MIFLDLLKNVGVLGQNLEREANLLKQKVTGAIDPIAYEIARQAQIASQTPYPQQVQQNLYRSFIETPKEFATKLTNMFIYEPETGRIAPSSPLWGMSEAMQIPQDDPQRNEKMMESLMPFVLAFSGGLRNVRGRIPIQPTKLVEPGYEVKPPPGSFPEGFKGQPISTGKQLPKLPTQPKGVKYGR